MSNNEYKVVLSGHINRYADQESVLNAVIAAFAADASHEASFVCGKAEGC